MIKLIGLPLHCHPSHFVNHEYDYKLNWTPLNPVTTTNSPRRKLQEVQFYESRSQQAVNIGRYM